VGNHGGGLLPPPPIPVGQPPASAAGWRALPRRARWKRPVPLPGPRRRPPPQQQLRAADLPAGLRRAALASQRRPRQAGDRGRHGMAVNTGHGMAARRAGKAVRSAVRRGHPAADLHRGHRALPSVLARGQAASRREDRRPQQRARSLPGQRRTGRRRRAASLLAAGQGRADAARPPARPQDVDDRGRDSGSPRASSSRQQVESEATDPNRAGWSARTAMSLIASAPSAIATARSTSTRPGSCRGRGPRTPSSAALSSVVSVVVPARSATAGTGRATPFQTHPG
jgi:hypothetical protein